MPNCEQRIIQRSSNRPDSCLLREAAEGETYLHLKDFELWVQHFLNDWLNVNLEENNACSVLATLLKRYTSVASKAYEDIPEARSLMILTSMELWIALDKRALRDCKLLQDYDPEFPISLLDPLLLPKKSQMERLLCVEQYLDGRRAASVSGSPSIFRSIDKKESFAVRYSDRSSRHKDYDK